MVLIWALVVLAVLSPILLALRGLGLVTLPGWTLLVLVPLSMVDLGLLLLMKDGLLGMLRQAPGRAVRALIAADPDPEDWGPGGCPVPVGSGIDHLEQFEHQGRPCRLVHVQHVVDGQWYVMTRLPRPLPLLAITPDDPLRRDRKHLWTEDVAFNERFAVTADDESPTSRRYVHDMLHPRQMEHLLSTEPRHLTVKGSWMAGLIYSAADLHSPDFDKDRDAVLTLVVGFAERIPNHVFERFTTEDSGYRD